MTSQDIAQQVADARFTPVRLREGYDMREVDDLLDRIVAAASDPQAVDALVSGARFSQVRFREGYDMPEVDAFLARLVGRPVEPSRTEHDGGIRENRGWWSRLFGPKTG